MRTKKDQKARKEEYVFFASCLPARAGILVFSDAGLRFTALLVLRLQVQNRIIQAPLLGLQLADADGEDVLHSL